MSLIETAQFIDTVVPKGIRFLGFTDGRKNDSGKLMLNCAPVGTGQALASKALKKMDEDLYFALASFKQAKIYDPVKQWSRSYREQANVDMLKALWLDVDFKSYDSPNDCIEGVGRFLEDLPIPTFVVNSGGGLHLYWVFDEAITPARWLPMAQGLAGLARYRELRADFGVTTDSARVLRLPGSNNQKYAHKPPCEVKSMGSFAHIERMEKLLLPYALPAAKHQQLGTPPPFPIADNLKTIFNPAMNADLSDGYKEGMPSSFALIAKECPVIANSLATAGADDGYILWKNVLHLAAFTEDGEDFVHRVSEKYSRYDPVEADMRYSESVMARQKKIRGPTACATFSAGSPKCDTCKYLNTIKSPWILGVVRDTPVEPSHVRNNWTYRMQKEKSDDGGAELMAQLVCQVALSNWRLVSGVSEGDDDDGLSLFVDYDGGGHTIGTLRMNSVDLQEGRTVRLLLFRKSLTWTDTFIKRFREVAMAWIELLRKQHKITKVDSLGWTDDDKGFVIGDTKITVDGDELVHLNDALGKEYSQTGDAKYWSELAAILANDSNPQFPFILAAGFAAPLMAMGAPLSLALSAYSRASGTGKSTLLKAVYGAFCSPRTMMALDDTSNYITQRIGMTQGLPVAWDEIRGDTIAKQMTEVIFRVTQGKSKGRLHQNAEMQNTMALNAMVICATNTPLMDYVNDYVQQTDAGALRFMEFNMDVVPDDNDRVRVLVGKLERNYGHAGRDFLRYIVNNREAVEALLEQVRRNLEVDAQFARGERFWADGLTKIVTAALLMNASGVLKIDAKRVRDYALVVLAGQRDITRSVRATSKDLLSDVYHFMADDMLVTDTFMEYAKGRSLVVLRPPRGNKVRAQLSVDEKRVRISNNALSAYAKAHKLSTTNMRAELKTEHGGRADRFSLGAGTGVPQPQSRGMVFDVDESMVSAWTASTPGSGTP